MASIISSIDSIISGLVISESFPEYGSIIFFLLFFVIFSITFASTAFIPVFKGDDKMNNIRAVIAFSVAFLSSIYFFDFLTQFLLFFGVWMVTAFFASFAIIAVIPKDKRKDYQAKIIIACLLFCLIVTIVLFFGYLDEMLAMLDPVARFFSKA